MLGNNSRKGRENVIVYNCILISKCLSIAGLFAAAFDLGIEWLIAKAIADFADGKGSTTTPWEPFASVMAASVVFNFLSDANVFREWPHYQGNDNYMEENIQKKAVLDLVFLGERTG